MCHLVDTIGQYRNVKMRGFGLYENRSVVFKGEYRRTYRRRGSFIEEGVRSVEETSTLGKRMNSDSYRAEEYHPNQKARGHTSLVNSNNKEAMLLSEIKQLLKEVQKGMDNYKGEFPKIVIENCRTVFNVNAVNLFLNTGDKGGYTLLSLF